MRRRLVLGPAKQQRKKIAWPMSGRYVSAAGSLTHAHSGAGTMPPRLGTHIGLGLPPLCLSLYDHHYLCILRLAV